MPCSDTLPINHTFTHHHYIYFPCTTTTCSPRLHTLHLHHLHNAPHTGIAPIPAVGNPLHLYPHPVNTPPLIQHPYISFTFGKPLYSVPYIVDTVKLPQLMDSCKSFLDPTYLCLFFGLGVGMLSSGHWGIFRSLVKNLLTGTMLLFGGGPFLRDA